MLYFVSVEYRSRFFRQSRTEHVQKQVAGEVSLTPGAVISCWFPNDFRCKGILTGVEDARYLSTWYMLRKARRNLHFDPPKLGDPPPTSEPIAPFYHSLLLQSPSLRSCSLKVARPVVL